ncbi:enoyl-CoA hydratase/isomerase family protein [Variovorax ginsengisoli]|uniref:Enoyl-CoA hydratase-related protein n=1 Tax=Variovorax ginsengisoli TaxID=363844 RepID=A0ABT8SEK6_9BURK|nr:enoyl-CoA hydratase-related protein [Variovorax ginsengisoli]MDN8618188.1 enoyl-CoA hydratase-related protein [Variovorax ginsengisoli]MDO1537358.1 enoyl-CoA hydratase-related protein [Variovorax ginsengisoli]
MAVLLKYLDEFAVIKLERPEALNALNFGTIRELGEAFDNVARSPARALVITGAGEKSFCAGADIAELQGRSLMQEREGAELGQQVFAQLDRMPMASLALVNGYAFGGGAELALACTFRLGMAGAKFGLPEIKLGLIPGYGGTQRLPRLVGAGRALEIIMSGRTLGIDEALAIGLVNGRAESLDDAFTFARTFCRHSLIAQRFAREAVQRSHEMALHDGLRLEADLSTLAYRSADAAEGMKAFSEKRAAKFKDT